MSLSPGPSSSSLPAEFLERLGRQFPKDYEKIAETFHQRPPVIRVNQLLLDPKKLKSLLKEKGIAAKSVKPLPDSLLVEGADRMTLTSLPEYQEGYYYIQSIASQLVVKALDPKPGEKILDLCAAPGSKTTQIAIAMAKKGELIANEPSKGRFFKLKANLKSQQVEDFVQAKSYPGQNFPRFFPDYFDKVLVDAPCSSEARFDEENPKTTQYWSHHKIRAFQKLQKRLLMAGIRCTKPGGLVVYSTCTFSPEENELVIDAVLRKHPEVKLLPISWEIKKLPILGHWKGKDLDPSLIHALRIAPDRLQEGFFIVVLLKEHSSSNERKRNLNYSPHPEKKLYLK